LATQDLKVFEKFSDLAELGQLKLYFSAGVYLPLLWESSFCSSSPIALGYTRGHFCALVPPEPAVRQHLQSASTGGRLAAAATSTTFGCTSGDVVLDNGADNDKSTFLPLTTSEEEGKQVCIV